MDPENENDQGSEETQVAGGEATQGSEQSGTGLNPAWNDLLSTLPSSLHSQVTPHLQKWDQNYDKSINEVKEQYSPYQRYLDQQIDPDNIDYALNVLHAIETDPGQVINAIREYAKENNLTIEEAAQEVTEQADQVGDQEDDPVLNSPAYKELAQKFDTLAQFLGTQYEAEQQSQEDAELDQELEDLQEKYGEFDVDWVLTKAVNGDPSKPLEDYVKDYQAFVNQVRSVERKPGPKVVSGGGQAPTQQTNVKEMDPQQRRAYVAELLKSAHENQG